MSPSYGKLDYLLHVTDHFEYAERQLQALLSYPSAWPASVSDRWRTSIEEDRTYVIGKAGELINAVASTKKLVCHWQAYASLKVQTDPGH